MNFGEILDEWDRRSPITQNEVPDKDSGQLEKNKKGISAAKRKRLHKKKPDAEIDLHQLNQTDAWKALDDFFAHGKELGYEKLQIIHGKGSHEGSSGVLKDLTRKFIEECPFAGESGYNLGASGGSGATWVLLK